MLINKFDYFSLRIKRIIPIIKEIKISSIGIVDIGSPPQSNCPPPLPDIEPATKADDALIASISSVP